MDPIDIERTAQLLLTESASPGVAEARCLMRIRELLAAGDADGVEAWGRILDAVEKLRRQEPLDGEFVH